MIAVGLVLSSVFIPCAFIIGNHRPVFPAVRADDRLGDRDLDIQLADALSGSGRDAAAAARERALRNLPWPAFLIWEPGPASNTWARVDARGQGQRAHEPAGRRIATMVDLGEAWGLSRRPPCDATRNFSWAAIALVCLMKPINWVCGMGFELFNRGFQATRTAMRGLSESAAGFRLVLLAYGGVLGLTYWGFLQHAPGVSFPSQDMGYLLVNIQLPDSASLERTQDVIVRWKRSPTTSRASTRPWASPGSRS